MFGSLTNSNSTTNMNPPTNTNFPPPKAPAPLAPTDPWGTQNNSGFGGNNSWGGNGGGFNDFNSGFGDNGWGGGMPQQPKRLTPEERVQMIEKVYQEILGRKPDTRDINYYKYSTLEENEIRKQLLVGKEHVELINNGREFKKLIERCEQAEGRVKMLESQIRDQILEFQKLVDLLREKNRHIQELKRQSGNPYNLK